MDSSDSKGHVENWGWPEDLKDLAGQHREDEPAGGSCDEHEGGVVGLQVGQHARKPGEPAGELKADEEAHQASAQVEEVGVRVAGKDQHDCSRKAA